MERLLLSLGLYHLREIKWPKFAKNRLKLPTVDLNRLKSPKVKTPFLLILLKLLPKVALMYGSIYHPSVGLLKYKNTEKA